MSWVDPWLRMARVSNTPTTVSDTVAGAVLVTPLAPAGPVAVVAVAIALFYTAGMILNDVMDLAIDRRERPERPLPAGEVSVPAAVAAVVALFAIGEVLLVLRDWRAAAAGLGLIALIVVYDAWHKGNAISPVLMGACRAMVYVVAGLAIAGALNAGLWVAAALLLVYVASLTQVAKVVRSGRVVATLIAGIAVYDALVVIVAGGSAVAVAVCLAAFAVTIALQTKIQGT
jgi:4-hydroxybenzoate polyprenyltransferase